MLDLLKALVAAIADWILAAPRALATAIASGRSGGSSATLEGGQTKKIVFGGLLLVLGIVAVVRHWPVDNPAVKAAQKRVYMCVEKNKTFEHEPKEGDVEPIESPYTDRNTGWLPEACYWTPDGQGGWKAKEEPTYVVLKSRLDPDSNEPTLCPDCGREVRPHNPRPR